MQFLQDSEVFGGAPQAPAASDPQFLSDADVFGPSKPSTGSVIEDAIHDAGHFVSGIFAHHEKEGVMRALATPEQKAAADAIPTAPTIGEIGRPAAGIGNVAADLSRALVQGVPEVGGSMKALAG